MVKDLNGLDITEEGYEYDKGYVVSQERIENDCRCGEIVVEINTIRRQTMSQMLIASVEIGRLLCEAKEKLAHGDWGGWLIENFEYSQSTANNLMKLFKNYGKQDQLDIFCNDNKLEIFGKLSPSQALALLPLPEQERREFVETHDMAETSVRDIEDEIKKRKNAEEAAERASMELSSATGELELLKKINEEVQERENSLKKELEKVKTEAAKSAEAELKKAKKELKEKLEKDFDKRLASEKKVIADKLSAAEKQNAELMADRSKADAVIREKLEAEYMQQVIELEDRARSAEAKLATAGDASVQRFAIHFENLQNEYRTLLELMNTIRQDNAELAEKFKNALQNVVESMRAIK